MYLCISVLPGLSSRREDAFKDGLSKTLSVIPVKTGIQKIKNLDPGLGFGFLRRSTAYIRVGIRRGDDFYRTYQIRRKGFFEGFMVPKAKLVPV